MRLKDWLSERGTDFTHRDLSYLVRTLFPREQYCYQSDFRMNASSLEHLERIYRQYHRGVPLAYSLQQEEFFGLTFFVSPHTFIPRPETELLVEKALDIICAEGIRSVLDVCCGTGCIGIAIDKNTENAVKVIASDISLEALADARRNVRAHCSSVQLLQADLFSAFSAETFDLIVANPPYIAEADIGDTLCHEPRIALSGGASGLEIIERIIQGSYRYLNQHGYLIMEMGYNQKQPVSDIIQANAQYTIEEWIQDYASRWRGVVLRRRSHHG